MYQNLDLTIKKVEAIGIIGESGTGNPLANLLVGLIKPLTGDILIDEKSIHSEIKVGINRTVTCQKIFVR